MSKSEERRSNIDLDIMNMLGSLNCSEGEDCYLYMRGDKKDCFVVGEGEVEFIVTSLVTAMKGSDTLFDILSRSVEIVKNKKAVESCLEVLSQ